MLQRLFLFESKTAPQPRAGRSRAQAQRKSIVIDKRAASVDRNKLADYSIVRELIQNKAVPVKK